MQCWWWWVRRGMGTKLEEIAWTSSGWQASKTVFESAGRAEKALAVLSSGAKGLFSSKGQPQKSALTCLLSVRTWSLASRNRTLYSPGHIVHHLDQGNSFGLLMTFHTAAAPAATFAGQSADAQCSLATAANVAKLEGSASGQPGVDMQMVQESMDPSDTSSTSSGSGDTGGKAKPGGLRFRERIMIDRVFEELALDKLSAQVGGIGKKVRHHVNPLRAEFQVKAPPPVWSAVFADPLLPLHVDIGCAQGRFLLTLAKRNEGAHNFLGLEIRSQLVERGNRWCAGLGLRNAHFLIANATISFDSILSTYPGPLSYVTILCPDPHFKNRVRNRRVVQPSLVEAMCEKLVPGGKVFVQSDVLEVAEDMKYQLQSAGGTWLDLAPDHACSDKCTQQGWLLESPLGVPTERETFAVANGESIYRALFVRNGLKLTANYGAGQKMAARLEDCAARLATWSTILWSR